MRSLFVVLIALPFAIAGVSPSRRGGMFDP